MRTTTTTKNGGSAKTNGKSARGAKKAPTPEPLSTKGKMPAGVIKIYQPNQERLRVRVIGTAPLVVHGWSKKAGEMLVGGKQSKIGKGEKDPVAEFEAAKYVDDAGRDCIKAEAFKAALVGAARFTNKAIAMTEVRALVRVEGDLIPIEYDECVMRFDIVRVGGKGPGTGTASPRYRPEYRGWSCEVDLIYYCDIINAESVLNLCHIAGFCSGLHEMRPEKGKDFGTFTIEPAF